MNITKLLKVLSWQDANKPLSVSEKARLAELDHDELDDELHRMAIEYNKERYGL